MMYKMVKKKKLFFGGVVDVFVQSNGVFEMMLLHGGGDVGAQRVGANYEEFVASFLTVNVSCECERW